MPFSGPNGWLPFWLAVAAGGAFMGAGRPSPWRSVPEALGMALPPLVAAAAAGPGGVGRLARAAVAAGFVVALWGLVQAAGLEPGRWLSPFHKGVASTMGNPDLLGGFLVMPFALALSLALSGRRALGWVAAGVAGAALLATEARAAWLGAGIASVLLLAWRSPAKPRSTSADAVLAFIFLAVIIVSVRMLSGLSNPTGRDSRMITRLTSSEALTQRLWTWRLSARALAGSPVTGLGAGSFRGAYLAAQTAEHARGRKDYLYSEHAHLEPLHIAVEFGVVGLGIWLWGLAAVLRGWFLGPLARSDPAAWRGIGAGAAGVLANGLLSFPFHVPPTAALFWLLLAPRRRDDGERRGRAGMLAGLAVTAVLLVPAFRLAEVSILMRAGQVRVLAGAPGAAAEAYARARGTMVYDWRLCWQSAVAENGSARPDAALSFLAPALSREPDMFELWHEAGGAEKALGRTAEAEAAYRRAVGVNPGFAHSWNNLGNLLGRANRLPEAERAQRRALVLDPGLVEARRNLAVTLMRMRRTAEARRILEGGAP
jgi:hypothetical protein